MKARVIVTLVVEEGDDDDDDVRVLQNILTKVGAVVHIMEKEDNITCVLMAQTARMLAYNLPMVSDDDLIMMADTDMFPTDEQFLKPLHQSYQVWIYWWEAVVFLNESFPMSMLAMKAKTWSTLLNFSTTVLELSKLPGSKRRVFTEEGDTMDTWEVDQSVTTTAILQAGLCSAPALAAKLGLTTLPTTKDKDMARDQARCWHGQGWGQCRASLGMQHYPGMPGCTWWHALLPAQLLARIVDTSTPLYRLAANHGLLFESDPHQTQVKEGEKIVKLEHFGF